MKITKRQLKQIIKEELKSALKEGWLDPTPEEDEEAMERAADAARAKARQAGHYPGQSTKGAERSFGGGAQVLGPGYDDDVGPLAVRTKKERLAMEAELREVQAAIRAGSWRGNEVALCKYQAKELDLIQNLDPDMATMKPVKGPGIPQWPADTIGHELGSRCYDVQESKMKITKNTLKQLIKKELEKWI